MDGTKQCWGRDKMAAIFQKILSNTLSWMKMYEFQLRFHWNPKGQINNIPALVQIMAWCRPGDTPLSEPMMASLCWLIYVSLGLNELTHWGRDKMTNIYQRIFSNAFSWMKIFQFRFKSRWNLFSYSWISNIPSLVRIMAWRRPGDKPLSEPITVS